MNFVQLSELFKANTRLLGRLPYFYPTHKISELSPLVTMSHAPQLHASLLSCTAATISIFIYLCVHVFFFIAEAHLG